MKISTRIVLLLLLATTFSNSFAQTVISNETFPTSFNTGYTSPINKGFYEDIGKWIGYTSDSHAVIAVDNKKSFSGRYALRLCNNSTVGLLDESTCRATGPIVNCTPPCVTDLTLRFKLFNLNVDPANKNFFLFVLVSKDNGTTWTTILMNSAAELVNSYGTNKWSDVSIKIPAEFYTSSLRYRFVGCHLPGSSYENCLYIDDIKIVADACPSPKGKLRLGNQVWNDRDGDGKRDTNEPAIGGVTISLYTDNNSDNLPDGAAIKTTMSDAQGRYLFTDLPEGRYIASMPIIPGYQQSPNTSTQATSPFPDNNVDNDDNLVRRVGPNAPGGILYTNAITLNAGQEPTTDGDDANGNLTFDLAECGNSFIGDFVWNDLNGNGIQDANEPGINGVLVTLTFEDGTTATETTHTYNAANNQNAPQYDGYYDFKNLGPGTYKVAFATPSGFNASPANQGSNDAKDSDPVNGGPVTVTIAANQSDFTIDAGFTKFTPPVAKLRLGNQVWNDRDGDGKRDTNEPAIGGVTISLYTDNNSDNLPDGAAIKTTMSDAQGHYLFTDLPEGRYIASMPIIPGYQQSPNTSTQATSPFPDNNVDNDDNLVRRVGPNAPGGILYTNAITLTAGQEPTTDGDDANGNLTFDLAECGNSFIGDFVWNDLNGNGIQNANEPGINGVLVTLTFEDGTTATETTHTYNAANNQNAPQYDGYYDFKNLGPGTYKVAFATPSGFNASPANQGSNDAKDSDPVNGSPVTVTIAANQSDFTIDAGFTKFTPPVAKLRLGNQVWNDRDGDGKRDDNEPAIGGVTISLYTDNNSDNLPDGAAIRTTQSDVQGHYLFTDLPAGRYIASMPIIPGYQQSPNNTTGGIVGAPKPGCCSLDPDADKDNDNNLVRLVGPNAPGGIVYTNAITLSAGQEPTTDGDDADGNLTFDLAECGNSGIGDFVWNDLNGNGIQDAGEPGINGVLVTITFEDGRTASVLTHTYNAPNNANAPQYDGYYDFLNLGPGTYKITFAKPAGFNASPANVGNDAKDSDPVNGGPVTVTLAANQSDFTIDAGFTKFTPPVAKLRLGNQVWNDRDGDGKRDPNEPAIGGVTISLYTDNNSDNLPDGAAIKTTMSDAQGHYLFTDLPEGRYIASMPIIPGYQQSPNTSTQATSPFPDNNVDNDDNLVRRVGPNAPGGILYTNAITLNAGQEPTTDGDDADGNLTFDLAECGNSFIGDFVWNDLNGNGIQDAGEPGINGVLVTLTFEDGTTATETTHTYNAANNQNAPQYDGYYDFKNLGPGTYKVAFATPSGFNASPANQGSNDAKDSDPVNGGPVTVTIAVNQSDFTIDAGFTKFTPPPTTCPNLSVGNKVFIDLNGNGIKEFYEPGIGGLTVKLYTDNDGNDQPDGAAIAIIVTDEDGIYYFGNLAAGKYIVGVTTGSNFSQGDHGNPNPNDDKNNDNNGVRTINGEVRSNFITLSPGDEPINDGSDNNSNFTLDFGLKPNCGTHCYCHNDCNHTDCGHLNCSHNNCHNDCNHTGCGHPNCAHNSCHNDCNHTGCGHPNCGKSSKRQEEETSTVVSVFPNPTKDYFTLKVNATTAGEAIARITDASGHFITSKNVTLSLGSNTITFNDLGKLKSGTYNVQVLFNYHVYNEQLILVK